MAHSSKGWKVQDSMDSSRKVLLAFGIYLPVEESHGCTGHHTMSNNVPIQVSFSLIDIVQLELILILVSFVYVPFHSID